MITDKIEELKMQIRICIKSRFIIIPPAVFKSIFYLNRSRKPPTNMMEDFLNDSYIPFNIQQYIGKKYFSLEIIPSQSFLVA